MINFLHTHGIFKIEKDPFKCLDYNFGIYAKIFSEQAGQNFIQI